jgi:hypothetical protein
MLIALVAGLAYCPITAIRFFERLSDATRRDVLAILKISGIKEKFNA